MASSAPQLPALLLLKSASRAQGALVAANFTFEEESSLGNVPRAWWHAQHPTLSPPSHFGHPSASVPADFAFEQPVLGGDGSGHPHLHSGLHGVKVWSWVGSLRSGVLGSPRASLGSGSQHPLGRKVFVTVGDLLWVREGNVQRGGSFGHFSQIWGLLYSLT